MGEAARTRMMAHFSMDTMVSRYLSAYKASRRLPADIACR